VKLIQRVSKAFQHLGPEGGVIRLRLAPSELGSVRVEMRVKQRKVEARVVAETDAAGAALREHLPELRQRLESQRMQVERLEIEVEQGETEFGGQTGRRDPRDMPDPDGHRPRAPRPSAEIASRRPSPPPTTEPGPRLVTVDGRRGVDVRL
jgi:flagellar hook-length control protein FliK